MGIASLHSIDAERGPFRFGDRYALIAQVEMFNSFNNKNKFNPPVMAGTLQFRWLPARRSGRSVGGATLAEVHFLTQA
jgi:hypothetical protein